MVRLVLNSVRLTPCFAAQRPDFTLDVDLARGLISSTVMLKARALGVPSAELPEERHARKRKLGAPQDRNAAGRDRPRGRDLVVTFGDVRLL